MGEKSERADYVTASTPDKYWKNFVRGWQKPDVLIPAPAYNPQEQRRRASVPQEPLWDLFVSWVSYYFIQIHWDIERALARLFRRRWGS